MLFLIMQDIEGDEGIGSTGEHTLIYASTAEEAVGHAVSCTSLAGSIVAIPFAPNAYGNITKNITVKKYTNNGELLPAS